MIRFDLTSMVQHYTTVGSWVFPVPADPRKFHFDAKEDPAKGIVSTAVAAATKSSKLVYQPYLLGICNRTKSQS